jgi:outer membrane protein OmpA-like peptidoglycan-associated protein
MKVNIGGCGRMGVAAVAVVSLAGCSLSGVGSPPGRPSAGPPVRLTQRVAPSALVIVTTGPESGPALSRLVADTARPRENLTVLQAGSPPRTVVASASPAPPMVVIPGRPAARSGGETDYQSALYAKRLKHWSDEVAAGRRADATQTRREVSGWLGSLRIQEKISKLVGPREGRGDLAAEGTVAASVMTGLEEEAGNIFASRRVVVLYGDDLSGVLPEGELVGDDVIVVTSYLPTAAAASAAQADLLRAGAAQAAVVGSQATAAQLADLVSAGLGQKAMHEWVSGPLLFANGSAALLPRAVRDLTRILGRLRRGGVTTVINGFASTPGTFEINYNLSLERANNVASFFISYGIPESSLIIVGHGASDVIGSGTSGVNRRVTVVIEEPSAGS